MIRLLLLHNFCRNLLGVHLDIIIYADDQIISIHRIQTALPRIFNFHAARIRKCQYLSVGSLQIIIILYLKPDDPLIVPAGKSKHFGRERVIGIIPFVILIHLYPGKPVRPDRVSDRLIHVCPDTLDRAYFLHALPHGFLVHPKFFRKHPDHRFRIRHLAVDHGYRTHCTVCRKHNSVAVQDLTARRLDVTFSFMQIFRLLHIIFRPEHHKIHQPADQNSGHKKDQRKYHHYFFPISRFIPIQKKPHKNRCFYPITVFVRLCFYSCVIPMSRHPHHL